MVHYFMLIYVIIVVVDLVVCM